MLVLPPVRLASETWTEVVVTLETQSTLQNGVAQLYWAVEGQGFAEQQSVIIELPPEPQQLNYHFFIPPRADGALIDRLRFDPVNQLVPVELTRMSIYRN
jgi:hypothetical protein